MALDKNTQKVRKIFLNQTTQNDLQFFEGNLFVKQTNTQIQQLHWYEGEKKVTILVEESVKKTKQERKKKNF